MILLRPSKFGRTACLVILSTWSMNAASPRTIFSWLTRERQSCCAYDASLMPTVSAILALFYGCAAQARYQGVRLARLESFRLTASFPRRVFGKRDRHAKDPRADRALKLPV